MTTALLLSGGMDSVSIAAWKRPDIAITINYGQRAALAEIQASAQVCQELRIRHEVVAVDCGFLGSGDMSHRAAEATAPTSEWWPYRNQLLVTLASMRAISLGVNELMIGTVASDGESHLDGSPEFVARISALTEYQEGRLRVVAPAIHLSTAQLVRASGISPGLLAWSHSCHKADIACGACRGCNKYLSTFAELGPEFGFA